MFIKIFLFRVQTKFWLFSMTGLQYSKTVSMTAEDRAVAEKIKNSSKDEII